MLVWGPGASPYKAFLAERVSYYSDSVRTFHQTGLIMCGDVEQNPGPTEIASVTDNDLKLNCLLINSLSLCNKLVEFQGLVYGSHWISLLRRGYRITWLLDNEILPEKTYSIFREDRKGNRRGRGVMLAVKADVLAYIDGLIFYRLT